MKGGGIIHSAIDANLTYFFYISHKPASKVREHAHSYYEIAYYAEGVGTTCIDGEEASYGAGQYALYRPGVRHTEEHCSAATVYCLGFCLPEGAPALENGVYTDFGRAIWGLIKNIRREFGAKEIYHNLYVNLYMAEILLLHFRNQQTRKNQSFDPMCYIMTFLDENFSQDIRLDTLAELSGYSPDHFRHMFKKKTGISPKQYVIQKRIEHAKLLLAAEDASIAYVAQSCGMSDSSQFTLLFKKYVGMSPSQFRRESSAGKDGVF